MSKIKIAVDAGHGSNTPGKRTPNMPVDIDFYNLGQIDVSRGKPIHEHYANVGVCNYLYEELIRCGFEVIKSAWNDIDSTDDEDISLEKRQKLILENNCDYSVSVHFNAFGDGKDFNNAEGVSIYYHNMEERTGDSKAMAGFVQKYLAQEDNQVNRGILRGGFAMVNCQEMKTKASILVELAFMTNQKEAMERVGNAAFWKRSAVRICQGICEYLDIPYVEEVEKPKVYYVQVGAFVKEENAKKLQQFLKKNQIDSIIKTE